jgi:hypothetical protein
MRLLIIKREKSFVACLFRIKVYVEDPMSGELVINNVSYRKLGELKNGEEKAFTISEDECRIAVIADKLSKDICQFTRSLGQGLCDRNLTFEQQLGQKENADREARGC